MMAYFFKRLLWFIPTLLGISILLFFLAQAGSTDPILSKWENTDLNPQQKIEKIKEDKHLLGLDLPKFYFSIKRKTESDTLNRIFEKTWQKNLNSLSFEAGNWPLVHQYFTNVKKLYAKESTYAIAEKLKQIDNKNELASFSKQNKKELNDFPFLLKSIEQLLNSNEYLPRYQQQLHWHGQQSQYHKWMLTLFSNQWDHSILSRQKEGLKIKKAIQWTILFSFLSLLFSILIALPCGFYSALHPNSIFDRFFSNIFFAFYAIPNFWMATLLLLFFASGNFFNFFPLYGIGEWQPTFTFWENIQWRLSHMALPLVCWTYGNIAYLYRHIRAALQNEVKEDYFLTAKAKGLSVKESLLKHAFKNALLPLITLTASALPLLLSGSIIIESIFNLPGMGRLSIDAFLARDYPLIFSLLLWGSILSLFSNFLADLAYHWADPRINMQKKNV